MSGFWQQFIEQAGLPLFPWLALAFVALTFVLRALVPEQWVKLRNSLALFLAACLGLLVTTLLVYFGGPEKITSTSYRMLHWFALLLGSIAVINVTSILLTEVILRALHLQMPRIVRDLLLALAYLITAFTLLSRKGVDISSLVATSAVITAVIGFSLQDTLGNVIGGVALQLERTINVGDWIRINDKYEGRVTEIRWRQTSIETRDWDTVVIPNSFLLKNQVVVLGRRDGTPRQHRMWVYFNIDFRYAPVDVIFWVEKALQAEPIPHVAPEPPPHCLTVDFKDSYITYAARYWLTDLALTDPTNSVVRTRLYAALKRANIPLSIPAQSVFITEDDAAHRQRKSEEEIAKRRAVLRGMELFHNLTDEELRHLAEHLNLAPFVRGEAIVIQGAVAHSLYVLIEGQAEVRITAEGGKLSSVVATINKGDVFGEMGLLTGEPRAATVVALSDTQCYRLDKATFEEVIKNRPEIIEDISHILARRRLELASAWAGLNEEAQSLHLAHTQKDLLRRIRQFFTV